MEKNWEMSPEKLCLVLSKGSDLILDVETLLLSLLLLFVGPTFTERCTAIAMAVAVTRASESAAIFFLCRSRKDCLDPVTDGMSLSFSSELSIGGCMVSTRSIFAAETMVASRDGSSAD